MKNEPAIKDGLTIYNPINIEGIYIDESTFCFLNCSEKIIFSNAVDWVPDDTKRLWRYNLHYFDYLREKVRPFQNKILLIDSWCANNPQACKPAWEPFTLSLRVVNWIFFFIDNPEPGVIKSNWVESLYEQALWLEKNDESHILANHYFENIKALVFAGVFFEGKDAERWLKKGSNRLKKQIIEQTLSDGGHYERSSQYHSLMLENYMDLYNLAVKNIEYFDEDVIKLIQDSCVKGVEFLTDITFPSGEIPLFNDSAYGVAPRLNELQKYAKKIDAYNQEVKTNSEAELIIKDDSGLYGYRSNKDMIIIDCGEIGPAYQPGHTHCDFLSYELMLNGQLLIVDTGVCEYESGEMRNYVRSTHAHNTVSVDGGEQSELWGEFRVARRAKKLYAGIIYNKADEILFEGAYKGFYGTRTGIKHSRTISITRNGVGSITELDFKDRVEGVGWHKVSSYIHMHPDLKIDDVGNGYIRLIKGNEVLALLMIPQEFTYSVDKSFYCPEFGKKINNTVITVSFDGVLPGKITYRLENKCRLM